MGQIQFLNQEQEVIFQEVAQTDFFTSAFYFTGGTALSSIYLHHRESEDLDFFTKEKFDTQIPFALLEQWGKKHQFTFSARFVEVVYICYLSFADGKELKLDFSYYPARQIEEPQVIDGMKVDSLVDIAVNKVHVISQRSEVKDFVDLYFLLQQFSLWDLITGVRVKFGMEVVPLLLAADFMKVKDFTFLPRMLKPLALEELKTFFREQAKALAPDAVE